MPPPSYPILWGMLVVAHYVGPQENIGPNHWIIQLEQFQIKNVTFCVWNFELPLLCSTEKVLYSPHHIKWAVHYCKIYLLYSNVPTSIRHKTYFLCVAHQNICLWHKTTTYLQTWVAFDLSKLSSILLHNTSLWNSSPHWQSLVRKMGSRVSSKTVILGRKQLKPA